MPDEERDDEKLLAEIRERFDYCQDYWKDIRDEAETDMKYYSGNPWPPAEVKQRKDAGRPSLVMDELSQNINQVVNDIRQNKRAVRVVPRGYGANDQTAELRGDLIREIEYKSNAQSAYAIAFENMCARSYGGWKIVRRYVSDSSFDQEIRIVPLPNPDCSYPDPDAKESDFSDARYWFLVEPVPRKEFKRKWPKAAVTDFNGDHIKVAPNWIKEDQVQVAAYFRVEEEDRELIRVRSKKGDRVVTMFEDEAPPRLDEKRILDRRTVKQRHIKKYITNGIEILEDWDEPGIYIPIVWLTAKELYVSGDMGPKRVLMSMIRLARDPQMMVNYASTLEAEILGMVPKVPHIGVVGQFHKPELWQAANTTPIAFLEYKAKTEATGDNILGPPVRPAYEAQVEPCEIARESARRAVQSAMGLSPLPTNAQKLNDKSGVALKQIDANEDRGSFHFIDKFEMALEFSGRIINSWIPVVYDTAREIGIRKQDDTHKTVKINQKFTDEKGQEQHIDMAAGEHEVTLATGPSFQSERDAADEFVETMVPELEGLPLDPTVKAKLLSLLIKLKNVGPIGDEMAKILSPDQTEQQIQQQLQQLQQQNAQNLQIIASLQAETQKLYAEKNGKVVDNEYMLKAKQMDNELKLAIAEITTKAQDAKARAELTADLLKQLHVSAHEVAQQAVEHAHQKWQSEHQAQAASSLAAQQAATDSLPQNGNGAQGD